MTSYDYDLFVIGGGSGGVRAARIAALHGAKVCLAEQALIGGTCVNVGCVPKKLLVMASHVRDELDDAAGFGWTIEGARFDWPTLITRKDRELERLRGFYRANLERAGVTLRSARARLIDAHTIELSATSTTAHADTVGAERVTARHILIATGAKAHKADVRGAEHAITSDQAFHLPALPRHAVIYGAGYIAVEFAGIFRSLGVQVTLVHHGAQILRGFDQDVRDVLAAAMTQRGIRVLCDTTITSIETSTSADTKRDGAHMPDHRVTLSSKETLHADCVLFATGRTPNTDGLGLEAAGVELGAHGEVIIDGACRSSVAHIHAIGDCTHRIQLTPVAIAEGHALADTLFGDKPRAIDRALIATAVFSQPTVATVGLTEEHARAQYDDVHVYQTRVRPMKDTLGGREERALFKLIVDGASERVIGCHLVGPNADEIIQGIAVAMRCGVTKSQLDSTIGIHPSLAEDLLTIRTRTR